MGFRYISVCSGIEAATVAWHTLGWKAAAFSEIEPFPRHVLQHHYPNVPLHGDFTTIKESDYGAINLLVGGTPCQSFSIAGLRKGLDDERGNLSLEFIRLAQRKKPQWVLWENVPGVLSIDGGRAFGAFLGGLAECGYGFAYRILDAQYFGVPQRRRRVFVVGYFGDWRPAAAVLFERESLRRDITPRREAWQEIAPTIRSGSTSDSKGKGARSGDSKDELIIPVNPDVFPTLDASMNKKFGSNQFVDSGQFVYDTAHTLRGEGFDASEDGSGRGTPLVPHQPMILENPIAFSGRDCGGDAKENIAPTMRSMSDEKYNRSSGWSLALAQSMQVRRLTPRECERLQGFPDDYTLIPIGKKMAADGSRYKALGNSMAVPVMEWIGERIQLINAMRES